LLQANASKESLPNNLSIAHYHLIKMDTEAIIKVIREEGQKTRAHIAEKTEKEAKKTRAHITEEAKKTREHWIVIMRVAGNGPRAAAAPPLAAVPAVIHPSPKKPHVNSVDGTAL